MKRLLFILLFFGILFESEKVQAQQGLSFHISYNEYDTPYRYAKKDIKEFRAFQKKIDQFSYAVEYKNFRKAQRLKVDIIRKMRSEIQDTRQKLRFVDRNHGSSSGLHQKHDRKRGSEYSKRDGNLREVRQLQNQLRKQTKLLLKLERLHLDRSRRFYKQGNDHLNLMYEFEETLQKDIKHSYRDYRYRNRRN